MPYQDYKRYEVLKNNDGTTDSIPFIELPVNNSDKYEYWNLGFSRMDKIAKKYYGSPFYDFLIIYANKIYLNEFDIPDGALIRIPFPLNKVKSDYEALLNNYRK
ncbi:MAG: hypothetical protein PF487_02785 [Bacteroidales bacterium]|jgi:hypothetical protein|nr:hypothetical protein [Bacteroidales bacterium]